MFQLKKHDLVICYQRENIPFDGENECYGENIYPTYGWNGVESNRTYARINPVHPQSSNVMRSVHTKPRVENIPSYEGCPHQTPS